MAIINLDDKKKTVEFQIGGEEFKISRVVLRVHILYGEYTQKAAEFLQKVSAGDTGDAELVDHYVSMKVDYIDRIMEKILSKNGYEYDKEWWADNVESYEDIEQFIVTCLTKDNDKKKAGAENLTTTE